jgi:hypothetical protein
MDGESAAQTVDRYALEALQFHWGEAYEIGARDGVWLARRRDGLGGVIEAHGPEQLGQAIRDDYSILPVPRHEPAPAPGTVYSAEGINTGLEADPRYVSHYPMTAHCGACGEVIAIRLEEDGEPGEWEHTGRMPGEGAPA